MHEDAVCFDQFAALLHMNSVFAVVEPSKIIFLICEILYPKRRIESYSILGTIESPNQILLTCRLASEP